MRSYSLPLLPLSAQECIPESTTNRSFFLFSLTSPPKTYISPSFPAFTLAACPNLGNGFAFLNFRILHGRSGAGTPFAPVIFAPVALDGDDGGEVLIPLPPEEKDVAGEGILPFCAEARVAGAAVGGLVFIDGGCCLSGFPAEVDGLLLLFSFLLLFRDQKDILDREEEGRKTGARGSVFCRNQSIVLKSHPCPRSQRCRHSKKARVRMGGGGGSGG